MSFSSGDRPHAEHDMVQGAYRRLLLPQYFDRRYSLRMYLSTQCAFKYD